MAVPVFRSPDFQPSAMYEWQLARGLVGLETAIAADKLSQSLRTADFAEAINVLDVSALGKVAFQLWTVANANDANTLSFYGWGARGPGYHMGDVKTLTASFGVLPGTGFVVDSHKSITDEFSPEGTYRGCDMYQDSGAGTADYASIFTTNFVAGPLPAEADFPDFFVADFTNVQIKYLAILLTVKDASTTSAAVIFRPLSLKRFAPQLTS